MGFMKVDDHWTTTDNEKDVVCTGSTIAKFKPSNTKEDDPMVTNIISYVPLVDRGPSLSQFE